MTCDRTWLILEHRKARGDLSILIHKSAGPYRGLRTSLLLLIAYKRYPILHAESFLYSYMTP